MKQLFIFSIALLFLTSFQFNKEIIIDKQEAKSAFAFLNKIRANPGKYYEELQFGKELKSTNKQLTWNHTLAKVAESKVFDMANRNYFEHTDPDGFGINYFIQKSGYKLNADWTKIKSANYFESMAANNINGQDAIRELIIDNGDSLFPHRKHLLGLDEWSSSLNDIGIGFARCDSGSTYKTYTCVIIAKHDW